MLNIWSILNILILLNILYYTNNNKEYKEYSLNRANSNYCNIFICYKKNFLSSLSKWIALMKRLSMLSNIPFFSKKFSEFFFLI